MSHSLTYKSSGVSPPSACYVYPLRNSPRACVRLCASLFVAVHACCHDNQIRYQRGSCRVSAAGNVPIWRIIGGFLCRDDKRFPPLLERRLIVGRVMKYVWCFGVCEGDWWCKVQKSWFWYTRKAYTWNFQAVMIFK